MQAGKTISGSDFKKTLPTPVMEICFKLLNLYPQAFKPLPLHQCSEVFSTSLSQITAPIVAWWWQNQNQLCNCTRSGVTKEVTQGNPESHLTALNDLVLLRQHYLKGPGCRAVPSTAAPAHSTIPILVTVVTSFALWGQTLDKYWQMLLHTFRQNVQVLNVSWLHLKLSGGGRQERKTKEKTQNKQINPGPLWHQMLCSSSCCLKVNFFKANISPENLQQDHNTFNSSLKWQHLFLHM